MKKYILGITMVLGAFTSKADYLLIPMDLSQTEHLKAYGVAYWVLEHDIEVDWLLNYRGGSFAFKYFPTFENEMVVRDVKFERIADGSYNSIIAEVTSNSVNMDDMKLDKVPKIAVYSPKNKQPWDDAVTLVLQYADIPYDIVYDGDVMDGKLKDYQWLHLHHEDFTGQYGKFYASYGHTEWYQNDVTENEEIAKRYGFESVAKLKCAVALKIKDYCRTGGFLFAMCSATDSYDIALSAENLDIVDVVFDGDGPDPGVQTKLDFTKTLAFENYHLQMNAMVYEFSDIDANVQRTSNPVPKELDEFSLFTFSAKWDPVPTMLCQNHTNRVNGFMGQTTSFNKNFLKSDVLIMGELKAYNEARYIHGNLEKGMWTFYGGHDPEDYQHVVGEEPTELEEHPNSPGYRLILNNILFPAAKPKKQKT